AAVGASDPTQQSATAANRVIGRIDANGNIDTTTALTDAYNGSGGSFGNVRGAASDDGTRFWLGGSGAAGSNGTRYATLGATTSTQIQSVVTSTRVPDVVNGQLYTTTSSFGSAATDATTAYLISVGSGLPTTTGQTTSSLAGLNSQSNPIITSPFEFALLHRSG